MDEIKFNPFVIFKNPVVIYTEASPTVKQKSPG